MTAANVRESKSTSMKRRSWNPPLHVRNQTEWNLREGVVYFLRDLKTGHIKIGFTIGDPRRRCRFAAASVGAVEWIGYFRARASAEIVTHRRFRHLRVRGEWFIPSEELMTWIRKRSPDFQESVALEALLGLSLVTEIKAMSGQSNKARVRIHSQIIGADDFDFRHWFNGYRLPPKHYLREAARVLQRLRPHLMGAAA